MCERGRVCVREGGSVCVRGGGSAGERERQCVRAAECGGGRVRACTIYRYINMYAALLQEAYFPLTLTL